jgi:hypothetical protein
LYQEVLGFTTPSTTAGVSFDAETHVQGKSPDVLPVMLDAV